MTFSASFGRGWRGDRHLQGFSGQSLLPSFSAGAGAFARSAGSCVRGRGSGVRARRSQQDLISQKASLGEPARPKKRGNFLHSWSLVWGRRCKFFQLCVFTFASSSCFAVARFCVEELDSLTFRGIRWRESFGQFVFEARVWVWEEISHTFNFRVSGSKNLRVQICAFGVA